MFGFNQDELLKKIQEAAEESKKKSAWNRNKCIRKLLPIFHLNDSEVLNHLLLFEII